MTVQELKEKLKDIPDHMDVMIEKTDDEFDFGFVQKADVRKVVYQDSADKLHANERCFVLSDEA